MGVIPDFSDKTDIEHLAVLIQGGAG
jgi:hypothetical protein